MDTTKITSAPTECQFHNNCGGWCESPREADHNLCADCLEAHDDDLSKSNVDSSKAVSEPLPLGLPTEQYQGEPVWYMIESGLSVMHAQAKALSERNGWDASAYSIPLYTRPAQGEPVGYLVQRVDPTGVPRLDRPLMTLCKPEEWGSAFKAQPLYTHADPAEFEAMRRLAEDSCNELAKRCLEHKTELEALRAQLAEAHALLRDVLNSPAALGDSWLTGRIRAALSASAEPQCPDCKGVQVAKAKP